MKKQNLLITACLILLFVPKNAPLFGADPVKSSWPQWRGPSRDGFIQGLKLPESLSENRLKQTWQVKLSPSYSGPIVDADRVFVTETQDKKNEVVRALDRKTGQELWKQDWQGAMTVPFFAKANGDWIRATPAFDGERLYVAGIRDVLVCLDADSGEELWRLDFVKKLGTNLPAFGFASSPLIIGDHVFVQAGGGLCKVDKLSGEIQWRVLDDGGGMFGSAFSSPYYAELNGEPQLIVQTRTKLAGIDPEDGKILWSQKIPAFRGMNILTPTVYKNSVFTSSYGGGSFLFTTSKNESGWNLAETWTNKTQAYMSSPIIIDGHAYLHLRNQRFTCIDLETGKDRWTTTPFGKYWSCVTDGEKILALDQKGDLLLIRANPEKFDLIDRRKIADDSWAHIAVSGNEIFVRALNDLSVYRWE
ncbi:PQQ-binding-like beta-propeller repeat protein [Gimesia aquarii]|uniref:Outer membrane protein assembly factor BamB n=1 Tax=Gimesia aquarii TaxID=2527964 RepID=A0A517VT18_9PLAN|nr:PQQ-binding-like beta-propeller repeat protein [Gimesia aquarii]QDT96099.1 Outer membrane protein assembly factor BamB precursor [Gimesia aquarii]